MAISTSDPTPKRNPGPTSDGAPGGFWSIYEYDEDGNRSINWWKVFSLGVMGALVGGGIAGAAGGASSSGAGGGGSGMMPTGGMNLNLGNILPNGAPPLPNLGGGQRQQQPVGRLPAAYRSDREQNPQLTQPVAPQTIYLPQTVSAFNVLPQPQGWAW